MKKCKIHDTGLKRQLQQTNEQIIREMLRGSFVELSQDKCPYVEECQLFPHRRRLCRRDYVNCEFYELYREVDERCHTKINGAGE